MLTSNKNGRNQWKSSKSINPDFLDRPETSAPINLTMDLKVFIQQKKIKDLQIKIMTQHQKIPFQMTSIYVIVYDIRQNKDIDQLFVRN